MKTQMFWALVVVCLLTFSGPSHAQQTEVGFSTAPQRPRPWDKVKEIAIGSAAPDWRLKTEESFMSKLASTGNNANQPRRNEETMSAKVFFRPSSFLRG
jgi:hypothetical protein